MTTTYANCILTFNMASKSCKSNNSLVQFFNAHATISPDGHQNSWVLLTVSIRLFINNTYFIIHTATVQINSTPLGGVFYLSRLQPNF